MKKQFVKDLPIYLNGVAIGWLFWSIPTINLMNILMYVLAMVTFIWYSQTKK